MSNLYLETTNAPTSGAYSQAVLVNTSMGNVRFVFLSGQTGNIPDTPGEPVIAGGIGPQTTQTLENLLAIVKYAYGYDEPVAQYFVALDVFLKDPGTPEQRTIQRGLFNIAYNAFFEKHGIRKDRLPARCMVWVAEVPLESPIEDTVIEIKGVAAIPMKEQNFF